MPTFNTIDNIDLIPSDHFYNGNGDANIKWFLVNDTIPDASKRELKEMQEAKVFQLNKGILKGPPKPKQLKKAIPSVFSIKDRNPSLNSLINEKLRKGVKK